MPENNLENIEGITGDQEPSNCIRQTEAVSFGTPVKTAETEHPPTKND